MTTLMAIGGAADLEEPLIFEEFIRRAGGPQARIVVLPQASGVASTGRDYAALFKKLGVRQKPVSLEFRARTEADRPKHLQLLGEATGVFLAGGTQLRITTLLGGTEFEKELLRAYRRGAVICGTSAGTAVLSRVMIAYGRGGSTPREGLARFAPGLGFTDRVIFDQHFRQRDRLGRLAYAIALHPGILGVGVDENTCAVLEDDRSLSVCGTNAVTVVDGQELVSTDVAELTGGRPVAVSGLKLHILTAGCTFDLEQRLARLPGLPLE